MQQIIYAIVHLSKYPITFLMIWFTIESYLALRKRNRWEKAMMVGRQLFLIFFLNIFCYCVLYVQDRRKETFLMMMAVLIYLILVQILYRLIYQKASMLLLNNVCMLVSISLIILTRLNLSKAESQFKILAVSTLLAFCIPVIVHKAKFLPDLHLFYAILGIGMLGAVLLLALTSRGAKLSISIGSYTFQFSELVKITLVLYLASALRTDNSFPNVVKATVVAALHVLILVASTDLGTAFVFFMAYVVIIYLATKQARYPLLGLSGMTIACVAAYFLFHHVRVRVALWQDPIANWDSSSQLAQALFGLCSGGWFGRGLYLGKPELIPIVEKDFTFDAICEEMGIIFGICLILLCLSTFLLMVNVSMKLSKRFYKLIAMGLAAEYATQVFLTIGGTIKCIPMTGITLPLVSYGGSSILATILMISIIQGLYILREDEGEAYVRQQKQKRLDRLAARRAAASEQKRRQSNTRIRNEEYRNPRYPSDGQNGSAFTEYPSDRQNGSTFTEYPSGRQNGNNGSPSDSEFEQRIERQTEESLKW